jgi:hypothetical protein
MPSLTEMLFLLQFIALVALVGMKLYNLMNMGRIYEVSIVWLMFIGGIFMYGLGMMISILGYEELIYIQIFGYERMLLLLLAIFHMIEVLLIMSNVPTGALGQRRNSIKDYKT